MKKIKSVMVIPEGQKSNEPVEMPFEEFMCHLSECAHASGYWSEEKNAKVMGDLATDTYEEPK